MKASWPLWLLTASLVLVVALHLALALRSRQLVREA